MMFMTAKVDFKKGLLILAGVAAVILALILIFGRDSTSALPWLTIASMAAENCHS